jgi:membrane protein DedA with SNARE-associated domain
MNLGIFLLYSTVGTLIWTSALTFFGYLLGENYEQVEHYLGPVSKIVLVLLVVAFGIWLWRRQRPIVPRL